MINDYQRVKYAAEREAAIARYVSRRYPADHDRHQLRQRTRTFRTALQRLHLPRRTSTAEG